MSIGAETFYGCIETTRDALIIIEAARQDILNRVRMRISHEEKKIIRHGSVFVFDERESKMKRWTDTRLWTPSRINGNFLVYLEAEDKIPKSKGYKRSDRKVVFRDGRKEVTGSKGTYTIKTDGLVKRTLSVQIRGYVRSTQMYRSTHHLISYEDPLLAKLHTPRDYVKLNNIMIGNDLLFGQGFKRPLDQNGDEFQSDEEGYDSRERVVSSSSSVELHSVFDSIWTQNDNIVNKIMGFDSSMNNEFEMMKPDISLKQSEILCNDLLDIEEITKELLCDAEHVNAKMPFMSSGDSLNLEEFLILENSIPWH